jgi:TolB-like protein
VRAAALAGAVITGALAGCASGPRVVPVPPALLADRPLVVMLPLSNLTGRNEQGDMVSKVFFAELARTGAFELVDAGEVERLTQAMRMRDLGSPTAGQVRALRDSTGARLVLAGSLLEAGTVRAPEGDIPTIGAALRLIDAETQRAVWADSRFLTGQDRETVFGWGRETSLSRLTSRLAREMFQTFRVREAARDTAKGGVR